jgi:D-glycerate 3-kinase
MMATIDEAIVTTLDQIVPLVSHRKENTANTSPFVLGLTGLQGSGKSTWANKIAASLREKHSFKAVVLSLDDLYFDHENLIQLRESNPNNALLRTRGQPGSHDTTLAQQFFGAVASQANPLPVPAFDKSKFNGEGDRVPRDQWEEINTDTPIDVLIFEGWCVGFQSLQKQHLEQKWDLAIQSRTNSQERDSKLSITTLSDHSLESVHTINDNLNLYCATFMGPQHLDCLIHLDTHDLRNVYRWRIQQEHALIKVKGEGMTDEGVITFVRGYMPSYELYLDQLRQGIFLGESKGYKAQLRIVLNEDRSIISVVTV